jgi:hypothetical protein
MRNVNKEKQAASHIREVEYLQIALVFDLIYWPNGEKRNVGNVATHKGDSGID